MCAETKRGDRTQTSAVLQIEEEANTADGLVVRLTLSEGNRLRVCGPFKVTFSFSERDREDLRWYLEDFLSFAEDPAPHIAARVETRICALGEELFRSIFQAEPANTELWNAVEARLEAVRVEVKTQARPFMNVPWELLRSPDSGVKVACAAQAFVRIDRASAQSFTGNEGKNVLRILLIISRPGGGADVPYRSVATRLLKSLKARVVDRFALQVLRPPSFASLVSALRDAHASGQSFDVVHFDGHGVYTDAQPMTFGNVSQKRGYLVFESDTGNSSYITGELIGEALAKHGVRLLVLNACQSAYAEPIAVPAAYDEVNREKTYGSLAQEIVRCSPCAVVAMQYKLYVTTAAQFIADLYGALQVGVSVGEAASVARRGLAERPLREIGLIRRRLQDWLVPIIYENAPTEFSIASQFTEGSAAPENGSEGSLGAGVSAFPPRVGFIGRDATLLQLDRAFQLHAVVQLLGYAGIGKTSTAIEFTNWLRDTGGLPRDAVLFTGFTENQTLECVVDWFADQDSSEMLLSDQNNWREMPVVERSSIVLRALAKRPAFWIWDGIDAIKDDSEAIVELASFLAKASRNGTRFLITTRKVEDWIPSEAIVEMKPLEFDDGVRFVRAAHQAVGRALDEADQWAPLVRYSQGNPLVLNACIGEGLSMSSPVDIEILVESWRAGILEIIDAHDPHVIDALRESFRIGIQRMFSDTERRLLSLLFLFRGYVNVTTFQV
jgi:hypothetical protein